MKRSTSENNSTSGTVRASFTLTEIALLIATLSDAMVADERSLERRASDDETEANMLREKIWRCERLRTKIADAWQKQEAKWALRNGSRDWRRPWAEN